MGASVSIQELSERVKARAAALGFDACGMADAAVPDPDNHLGEWIAQGCHAGMDWLARTAQARQDPRRVLPGAASVVVVARNYYAERPEIEREAGRVSRYAWGRDYHRVLMKPLKTLASSVTEMGEGVRCYCCVDTGAVMERVWAARAGLGWAGANGLLTTPGYGSWVFLGVILTTLPLAPDVPLESRCGMCRLCMQSCPTRAIVAPGVIDARRCIAYHTVENRGDIPEEVQRQMGEWVFGCDICQEVCPWNARPVVTTERRFDPVNHDIEPGVVELSEDAFNARFAGSAIRRAKREGIRRNMGIVGRG